MTNDLLTTVRAPSDTGVSDSASENTLSDATPATDIALVRRALRRLTLVATTVVLVSIPALFALAGLRALNQQATLEAVTTAERVAETSLSAGPEWPRLTPGLRRVMVMTPTLVAQIERSLLSLDGTVLIAAATPADRPVLRKSAPVMVGGRPVAEVMIAVSVRPMLIETALAALFAALIAAGLYVGIDRIALRALRQALDHLQKAVRERDQALQETSDALTQLARQNTRMKAASEELSRTRDAALIADRSKSMFLAAMSHELRTPLNAIIGFSEIMARQLYGPIGHEKYRDYASDIRSSGDHLLTLIDDVLDLSRVEAGKLVLRREPLDVAEQIHSCCRLVQGRATDSGIDLQFKPDGIAASVILGDRVRFRQILLNLLTNAVKFTNPGGTVRIEIDDHPTDAIVIRISDTGVGMSEDDLERVFRPFEQAGVGAARSAEGVGLGLALSRALVREHGGTVTIASSPGHGTVVTLTFPRLTESTLGGEGEHMSLQDALRDDTANPVSY